MALIADRRAVETFTSVEQYDFSNPMDYFDEFSCSGVENEEDDVFVNDGHIWFSLYLDEIVSNLWWTVHFYFTFKSEALVETHVRKLVYRSLITFRSQLLYVR